MNRVGIIGLGDFGSFLIDVFSSLKNFELTAVSEIDKSIPIPDAVKFYKNYLDLLNDPEIDIVHVATENFSHAAISKEALQNGKKVLAEKPLFIDSKSRVEIIQAFKKDPKLLVNFVLTGSPLYQRVFKTIKDRRLGELLYINAENYATESMKSKDWYFNKRKSGGWFVTSDIHFLHLIAVATSETLRLSDVSSFGKKKMISSVCHLYAGKTPVVIYHHLGAKNFEDCRISFVFEKGLMTVHGWVPTKLVETSLQGSRVTSLPGTEDEIYLKLIARNYKILGANQGLLLQFDAAVQANDLALKITEIANGKN